MVSWGQLEGKQFSVPFSSFLWMSRADSVTKRLIDRLIAGDEQAVEVIWDRFFPQLVRLARRQLAGQRRSDADEEDAALSAFASFCKAARQNRFPNLRDRESLWRLLSQMTRRKVVDLLRRRQRSKRGKDRVRGDSALRYPGGLGQVPDDGITPELCALLHDECRRLLDLLGDPRLQQLALLKGDGYTNKEIADQMHCSVATVERRLRLIRKKWEQVQPP
jgi:RNA polymerase sigma factor (sigma-70 family)